MIFGNHNAYCSVAINNNAIEKVDSIKFLGIILDSKLSWNDHIQLVTRKVSRSMGILYRVKKKKTEIIVYFILLIGITIFKLCMWDLGEHICLWDTTLNYIT